MALLDGKVAIVTGAAGGLGSAFASALAREGAAVALCDIDPAVQSVGASFGGKALARVVDVADPARIARFVDETVAALGGIDILVNNASVWAATPVLAPWDEALGDFERLVNTNARGAFVFGRLCGGHIAARGGGNIVNISTDDVMPPRRPGTNPETTDVFNATRWAMNAFTRSWAIALQPRGVRVNSLCVGPVDTALGHQQHGSAVGEWLQPAQVASLLIDLLREGPDGRTGENIGVWPAYPVELGPRKLPHKALIG